MKTPLDILFSSEGLYSTESRKPMNPLKKRAIQTNIGKIKSKKSTVVTKLFQYQTKMVLKMKTKFIKMKMIKIHYKKEEEYKEFIAETFDEYIEGLKTSNVSWFKKNLSFPIMEIDCNMQYKETVLSFLNGLGEQNHMKIINNDHPQFGAPAPQEHKEEKEDNSFPSFFLSHSQGYDNQDMIIRVSIGCTFSFENPFDKPKKE